MKVEFIMNNEVIFRNIDPVLDYHLINFGNVIILEYEYKFERYKLDGTFQVLINGKDLYEYEKERVKRFLNAFEKLEKERNYKNEEKGKA